MLFRSRPRHRNLARWEGPPTCPWDKGHLWVHLGGGGGLPCAPNQGRQESQNHVVPHWGPLSSTWGLPCTATLAFCTAEGPATRLGPLVLPVASPGSPCPAHSLLPPAGTAHKWAMSHLPPSLHRPPLMSLFCGFRVHPAPRLLKGFPPTHTHRRLQ